MKLKKYNYIIVSILMLVLGINTAYADSEKICYYMSGDDNLKISLKIGYDFDVKPTVDMEKWAKTTIWKTSETNKPMSSYAVNNWFSNVNVSSGVSIEKYYQSRDEANDTSNPSCPQNIIYLSCPGSFFGLGTSNEVYATNNSSIASNIINASSDCSYAGYASNYKNGTQITEDMFFTEFVATGLIEYDESQGEYTCADMDTLFGSKDDPDSVRYMVNEILGAVRIIAPILIILFGSIDFAKAVIAGKQDNMKKAQSDFIKRIIAGVAIFLIPTLVDIIMGLADIVWAGEYTHCDF